MPKFVPPPTPDDAVEPQQVRFLSLVVEPYPDRRRVRVTFTLPPCQQPPNLDFTILNAAGQEAAHSSIIETTDEEMHFTIHLRTPDVEESYTLISKVVYTDYGTVFEEKTPFLNPIPKN